MSSRFRTYLRPCSWRNLSRAMTVAFPIIGIRVPVSQAMRHRTGQAVMDDDPLRCSWRTPASRRARLNAPRNSRAMGEDRAAYGLAWPVVAEWLR